jgi:hypothetical protein
MWAWTYPRVAAEMERLPDALEVLAYRKIARPRQGIEQQGIKPVLADADLADALTAGEGWPVVASSSRDTGAVFNTPWKSTTYPKVSKGDLPSRRRRCRGPSGIRAYAWLDGCPVPHKSEWASRHHFNRGLLALTGPRRGLRPRRSLQPCLPLGPCVGRPTSIPVVRSLQSIWNVYSRNGEVSCRVGRA